MAPGVKMQSKSSQKKVQPKSLVAWKWWTHPETMALIDVWGDAMADYCNTFKGKPILPSSAYEKIAETLSENGIKRSVEQIREKIKTLKKSYWGALAKNGGGAESSAGEGRMNGKRQTVFERMRRILQAHGNIVKGKCMWKTDIDVDKVRLSGSGKAKVQRKSRRGRKVIQVIEEEEEEEEEEVNRDEMNGEARNGIHPQINSVLPVQEMNGDSEDEDDQLPMRLAVDPNNYQDSNGHWNAEHHHLNGETSSRCSNNEEEVTYNFSLCQVIESIMNKFLNAQRESEDRFLLMEDERLKAETKRWEDLQKRDEEVMNKLVQTCDKWRKEDKEQEMRMWAAFTSKLGTLNQQSRTNSKNSDAVTLHPPPPPVHWHLTGTLKPSAASDLVPSSPSDNIN